MSAQIKIRWNWLKGMYIFTIVVAGGFGAGLIFMPNQMQSCFKMPTQDPIVLGILGSVYVAFALLSILGLRSPLKFSPILLLQLGYKAIWFVAIMLPAVITQSFPSYAIMFVVVFAAFIIGDLIAIPFQYVLGLDSRSID